MNEDVTYRINALMGGFMLSIAALVDSIQGIATMMLALAGVPFLGLLAAPLGMLFVGLAWLLSVLAWILFMFWFMALKAPFLDAGGEEGNPISGVLHTIGNIFAVAGESIPVINMLPILSITVGQAIFASRKADREKSRKQP